MRRRKNDIARAEHTAARDEAERIERESETRAWEEIGDELGG